MEVAVALTEDVKLHVRLEGRRDRDDARAVLVAGVTRREAGDRDLDDLTDLEQLTHVSLPAVVEIELHLGQVLDDVRTVRPPLEQTERDEALDRFAHRGARDAELLAQRAFGRQLAARRELTGVDARGNRLTYLFGDRAPGDGLETDVARHAVVRSSSVRSPANRARSVSRSRGRMIASCSSSPQKRAGTSHMTSNSRPSGSTAYRLLFAPWSL